MSIPMVDLKLQYQTIKSEIEPAVLQSMADAAYINGPDVGNFERDMMSFLDVKHCIGVANGTDALHIAIRALGIGPGDEVITTAFTFIATGGTISLTGARPVFVDIDPASYNIDPKAIEKAITPRTKAIVPVHLFGQAADMTAIMEIANKHGLAVVEDCAQAAGATWKGRQVGTIGTVGCFSFFPSKNLGCFGDGGMVVSNDEKLAQKIRAIASHGSRVKYHNEVLGFNSRLDTVQAAILRVKLRHLAEWNRKRQQAAAWYHEALAPLGLPLPRPVSADGTHVYHQYTIRSAARDGIRDHLQKLGIASMIYYPIPLHRQELYRGLEYGEGSFPHSEKAAGEVLSLPMYPELTRDQVQTVAAGVAEAVSVAVSAHS